MSFLQMKNVQYGMSFIMKFHFPNANVWYVLNICYTNVNMEIKGYKCMFHLHKKISRLCFNVFWHAHLHFSEIDLCEGNSHINMLLNKWNSNLVNKNVLHMYVISIFYMNVFSFSVTFVLAWFYENKLFNGPQKLSLRRI